MVIDPATDLALATYGWGRHMEALLRHALEVTTVDRLIFSTDHPFQRLFGIDADREKFTSANAVALYGL